MPVPAILIADRSFYARLRIRKAFSVWHWEVLEAEDGEEAVKLYKSVRPSLVILDLDLPVLTGIEAANEIFHVNPDAALILCGGAIDRKLLLKQKGNAHYLEKPVNLNDLLRLCAEITRVRMR